MNANYPPYRGELSALVVQSMRRDGIKKITEWLDSWDIPRTVHYNTFNGRKAKGGEWVKPSIETLAKFARAFGMPTHELLYIVAPDIPGAPQ